MFEVKPRKVVAPDGYIYHKDGVFASTIYPRPSQDVSDYELMTIEEYEALTAIEEEAQDENQNI